MQPLLAPELSERLRVGPLAPYFDFYLARMERDGFQAVSVPCQAYAITRFSRWLQQKGIRPNDLNESTVQKFLDRDPGVVHHTERATLRRLMSILRELGIVRAEPTVPLTAVQACVQEYRQYLVRDRGLSPASIPNYLSFVNDFLRARFSDGDLCLSGLRAVDVSSFMKDQAPKLSPGRKKLLVTALRVFLRYLVHQGKIEMDLAGCVLPVASWSFSEIPKSLPPGTVQTVLAGYDRSTPIRRRNYAILLLLARLGLRAGEVVGLNLEDFDWDKGLIRIRRKGSRWAQLPLPSDVGAAIAAYLQSDRPPCSSRRVFLRHNAPIRGFAHTICVSSIVRRTLLAAGIDSERTGAHLFRHTLAVDLLREGASLDQIGDVLGHRSPNTTALYAKVDVAALRVIALPWPGGAR
jgi:site-specific recombinase XerD